MESARSDLRDAIVVLGCAVRTGASLPVPSPTLRRRIDEAVALYHARGAQDVIVVSGGKRWGSFVEADVMAEACEKRGVSRAQIERERCSLSTKENARFVRELLERRRLGHAWLVTCDWHMHRALENFRNEGVFATPYPAAPARVSYARRFRMKVRERVARTISWVLE